MGITGVSVGPMGAISILTAQAPNPVNPKSLIDLTRMRVGRFGTCF